MPCGEVLMPQVTYTREQKLYFLSMTARCPGIYSCAAIADVQVAPKSHSRSAPPPCSPCTRLKVYLIPYDHNSPLVNNTHHASIHQPMGAPYQKLCRLCKEVFESRYLAYLHIWVDHPSVHPAGIFNELLTGKPVIVYVSLRRVLPGYFLSGSLGRGTIQGVSGGLHRWIRLFADVL